MPIVLATLAAAALTLGTAQAAPAARFGAEITPVRWDDLRFTYRNGCPVGPAALRTVAVSHWRFDGKPRTGRIVVSRRTAPAGGGGFLGPVGGRLPAPRPA